MEELETEPEPAEPKARKRPDVSARRERNRDSDFSVIKTRLNSVMRNQNAEAKIPEAKHFQDRAKMLATACGFLAATASRAINVYLNVHTEAVFRAETDAIEAVASAKQHEISALGKDLYQKTVARIANLEGKKGDYTLIDGILKQEMKLTKEYVLSGCGCVVKNGSYLFTTQSATMKTNMTVRVNYNYYSRLAKYIKAKLISMPQLFHLKTSKEIEPFKDIVFEYVVFREGEAAAVKATAAKKAKGGKGAKPKEKTIDLKELEQRSRMRVLSRGSLPAGLGSFTASI